MDLKKVINFNCRKSDRRGKKVASLTFYFRDPFLRLFLHHLLLELDLCHLGHLLSLCQNHQFGQQEEDHETNAHTSFADWLQWSNDQNYQWWPSSFQFLLPFPRFSGSELWSTDESSLLPCMQDMKHLTHILFPWGLTLSLWLTQGNIFSRLHKFKVPPDRLGDLWLCDTDRLYQSIDTTERGGEKKQINLRDAHSQVRYGWLVGNVTENKSQHLCKVTMLSEMQTLVQTNRLNTWMVSPGAITFRSFCSAVFRFSSIMSARTKTSMWGNSQTPCCYWWTNRPG